MNDLPGLSWIEHCTDDIRTGEASAITLPSCHYTEHSPSVIRITKFTGTESDQQVVTGYLGMDHCQAGPISLVSIN